MNKANVVGTAVGLYLIRKDEPYQPEAPAGGRSLRPTKTPRTFENSEVRANSWPCVLVLVRDWLSASEFAHRGLDPDAAIPRAIYMPDGRAAPICVVKVTPAEQVHGAPADVRWPDTFVGGGCPLVTTVQGAQHTASIGCLVTDRHKTYALTSRHVSGEPGSVLQARVRGNLVDIGRSSAKQLTRLRFTDVFPELVASRTFLTLDIGLVDVDRVDDWTSQPFGLSMPVGDVADLNELNLGLQLIDQPVTAFGAASGLLQGTIKALFYRHTTMAGYDYVSQFLIAPTDGNTQTQQGDSGTVWHLLTTPDDAHPDEKELRPIAVEWGGQVFATSTGRRFNFALASGLSSVCQLLEVDLVRDHNTGATPYWGQTGHYSIAAAGIESLRDPRLRELMRANVDRISFTPGTYTEDQIREKLANGDFVELADIPDLVWKKTAEIPGGRDVSRNSGPEHPNHYADIDAADSDGKTLRQITLTDGAMGGMDVDVWLAFYKRTGKTDPREQGLLPFRVWQFFDVMVDALRRGDLDRFVCAAGVVSHYVGDACQPLHGSIFADGYRDPNQPNAKDWPGKGVHQTYEDKMVDRFSDQLLPEIAPAAAAFEGPIRAIADGRSAAFGTVELMEYVAGVLPPSELCDEYIKLGGGASMRVVTGLWTAFHTLTATVMGAGARYLAAIWDGALQAAGTQLPVTAPQIDEPTLARLYQDHGFAPSLTLGQIKPAL